MSRRKDETEEEYRIRRSNERRERYSTDEDYRGRQVEYQRKLREDPEVRKAQAEYQRKRRADPEVTDAQREARRKRYAENPKLQEQARAAYRKRMEDPDFRQAKRDYDKRRRLEDPEYRERKLAYYRQRVAPPEGHPGTCDCCGAECPPRANGNSGLNQDHRHDTGEIRGWVCGRCNLQVAVLDLRFTDPDRFAVLMAWSNRGAPIVVVPVTNPKRRKSRSAEPVLFTASKHD